MEQDAIFDNTMGDWRCPPSRTCILEGVEGESVVGVHEFEQICKRVGVHEFEQICKRYLQYLNQVLGQVTFWKSSGPDVGCPGRERDKLL